MKVINRPIEVVSWFDFEGQITPIRFRIHHDSDESIVYKIHKIMERSFEKPAGNPMWVYTCLSYENNCEKIFVLKYEISTCRWILFKC